MTTKQKCNNCGWLRKWADENGTVEAIVREDGIYYREQTVPAFEPGAGRKTYQELTLEEAMDFDPDPLGELSYFENEQAKIEHDPFFE